MNDQAWDARAVSIHSMGRLAPGSAPFAGNRHFLTPYGGALRFYRWGSLEAFILSFARSDEYCPISPSSAASIHETVSKATGPSLVAAKVELNTSNRSIPAQAKATNLAEDLAVCSYLSSRLVKVGTVSVV